MLVQVILLILLVLRSTQSTLAAHANFHQSQIAQTLQNAQVDLSSINQLVDVLKSQFELMALHMAYHAQLASMRSLLTARACLKTDLNLSSVMRVISLIIQLALAQLTSKTIPNQVTSPRMALSQTTSQRMVLSQTTSLRMALSQTTSPRMVLSQTTSLRMVLSQTTSLRMALNQTTSQRMALNQTTSQRMAQSQKTSQRMALSQTTSQRMAKSEGFYQN